MDCSIQSCPFQTSSPLGMTAHARKHRNEFERLVGRPPEDYDEVRAFFNGELELEITTLDDYQEEIASYG